MHITHGVLCIETNSQSAIHWSETLWPPMHNLWSDFAWKGRWKIYIAYCKMTSQLFQICPLYIVKSPINVKKHNIIDHRSFQMISSIKKFQLCSTFGYSRILRILVSGLKNLNLNLWKGGFGAHKRKEGKTTLFRPMCTFRIQIPNDFINYAIRIHPKTGGWDISKWLQYWLKASSAFEPFSNYELDDQIARRGKAWCT